MTDSPRPQLSEEQQRNMQQIQQELDAQVERHAQQLDRDYQAERALLMGAQECLKDNHQTVVDRVLTVSREYARAGVEIPAELATTLNDMLRTQGIQLDYAQLAEHDAVSHGKFDPSFTRHADGVADTQSAQKIIEAARLREPGTEAVPLARLAKEHLGVPLDKDDQASAWRLPDQDLPEPAEGLQASSGPDHPTI